MVVGNDDVEAHSGGGFDFGGAGDAAINGNHQADPLPVKPLQGGFFQPVTFRQAMRYVRNSLAAQAG